MRNKNDLPALARIGGVTFAVTLFVLLVLTSAWSVSGWLAVAVSLIFTAVVALFASFHLRISRLEAQVSQLSDQLYAVKYKD